MVRNRVFLNLAARADIFLSYYATNVNPEMENFEIWYSWEEEEEEEKKFKYYNNRHVCNDMLTYHNCILPNIIQ